MGIIITPSAGDSRPDLRAGRGAGPCTPPTAARTTRQRSAVAEILGTLQDFRSAQEIHAALRERGEHIGLATVYRALARLVAGGEVDVLTTQDGEAVYLHCTREHHHHLVCRSCGRAVAIDAPDVEHWAAGLAAAHGYTEISTTLEVFGRCPQCSADAAEH